MMKTTYATGLVLLLAVSSTGCATTETGGPTRLSEATKAGLSINFRPDEMVVAVSPAGKALRLAGSAGLILGTGVDAAVNAKYRNRVEETLGDYDANALFVEKIKAAIDGATAELVEVAPLVSTAGTKTLREAEHERFRALAKNGMDLLLDLRLAYGLYGPEGTMAASIDGELNTLPDGDNLWKNDIVVTTEPILADMRFRDPTNRMSPDVTRGFTVDEEAINQWLSNKEILTQRINAALDAAVAALAVELGVQDSALGQYHLGKNAMMSKDFDLAVERFDRALELDPYLVDALNGKTVLLARTDRVDEAIEFATNLLESYPDYAPMHFNLAYWYAIEKNDPNAARPHYDRALELGLLPDEKIEKALKKS